ncbi:hypothetical protein ACLHDG_02775 [Sulfurovum sp. CS9]|uniref:hypothetical protein n=1 Tax=Sulfurovum sp. CS9 TaxID=3391146 RepID=UPI0039E8879D
MKNMLENVAVTAVVILFLFIIALIVRYNMIADGSVVEDITQELPVVKVESKKAKTTNYLQNLESYTDVDVKVDPTKVNTANTVQVTSELAKDDIGSAVEGTDKSSYVDSLESYADKEDEEKEEEKTEDDKVKLDQEEIVDEIGMAIGDALAD